MRKFHAASLLCVGFLVMACSSKPAEAPDIKDTVRAKLDAGGLKDVSVAQDRTKGVVTLSGTVATEEDKTSAGAMAQSVAPAQVVANEIMVTPASMGHDAGKIHDAVDDGISANMKAMLLRLRASDDVSYSVESAVVTMTGNVSSQARRAEIESAAATVANVKQVVNSLQVKDQKSTTTTGTRPRPN